MKLGKSKTQKLEEARKMVEEAEKAEAEKLEQAKETPVISSAAEEIPKEEKATIEEKKEAPPPSKEEIAKLEEQIQHYNKNYRGLFNPNEMPTGAMMGEIASLLFGILQELRKK